MSAWVWGVFSLLQAVYQSAQPGFSSVTLATGIWVQAGVAPEVFSVTFWQQVL
jgi:hypothetical protein